jgi:hypothetical protein
MAKLVGVRLTVPPSVVVSTGKGSVVVRRGELEGLRDLTPADRVRAEEMLAGGWAVLHRGAEPEVSVYVDGEGWIRGRTVPAGARLVDVAEARVAAHLAPGQRRSTLHRTDPPSVTVWIAGRWRRRRTSLTAAELAQLPDVDRVRAHLAGDDTRGTPVRLEVDVAEWKELAREAEVRGCSVSDALRAALDGDVQPRTVEPRGVVRNLSLRVRPWERERWGADLVGRLRRTVLHRN